jgi:CRISPR-associated exonuclease Cas4
MLCCEIEYGYLYYGEVRRRHKVEFDNAIREKVKQIFAEMHKYYEQQYTPKVKISRKCNACSLKDICLPVLNKNKLVAEYITKRMQEEENL